MHYKLLFLIVYNNNKYYYLYNYIFAKLFFCLYNMHTFLALWQLHYK